MQRICFSTFRRRLIFCISLALAISATMELAWPESASAAETSRPNIVLILADDMGYGDLSSYGHPEAKTPRIDRLGQQGVRFTQCYANGPECTPTRTALLTGRYQQRAGGMECAIGTGNVGRYDDAIRLANQRELGLPQGMSILPSALKKQGYTCGIYGKWHLGYEPKFNPMEHGWDVFEGYLGGNVHYFNHRETSDLHVYFRGRLPVYREGYMSHIITDDSVAFINEHKDEPFFLYIAHECPHFPYQGPDDAEKVVTAENWNEKDAETYVAMLEDLDAQVGRVVDAVDQAGLAEKTLIVFVSDNGGVAGSANMGPLRGSKSQTFEGGIRVPCVMRWPQQIEAGSESDQVTATFDLTRSFLGLAGADVPKERLDGYDIVQHIVEDRPTLPRTLMWRGKRGDTTWWGVRDGDLKYVRHDEGEKSQQWLFNLESDIGEQQNLMAKQPGEAKRLTSLLSEWEAEVKAAR